ncbi:RodZ domain-containing protein [Neptunomonas antarctica]|nr:RodZ domain-containing protein [Neptunomonas antarctica]
MPDDSLVQNENQSIGERLRISRESQAFSQQAIADELHLPVRYIQWLEEGAFEKLPSLVFARGYIRSYAKIVGIDGALLIDIFNQQYGMSDKRESIRSVSKMQQQVKLGDPVMRWASWIFLIAIIAIVGWWWKTQYSLAPIDEIKSIVSSVEVETANDNSLALPILDDSSADATSDAAIEPAATDEPQDLSDAEIARLQSALDSAPETEVALQSPVESSAGEDDATQSSLIERLTITFNDDCWLTVKDADGQTLFKNIRKSGESLKLSGKEPLSLLIGRVSAIDELSYNGNTVDLAPYNIKNVAKLTLPLN